MRAEVARDVEGSSARRAAGPAWPRCWWATIRPRGSTSPTSSGPARKSESRGSTIGCAATTEHAEVCRRWSTALNADDAVSGILLQLPTPPQVDGPALGDADRSRQGRGRADARSAPGAWPGPATACGRAPPPGSSSCSTRRRGPRGGRAVVVGRSKLVGLPRRNCCWRATAPSPCRHWRTGDLASLRAGRHRGRRRRRSGDLRGEWVKPGRRRDRRRDVAHGRGPRGRRGLREAAGSRGAITPGAGRRGSHDDRDAPAQHAHRRAAAGASRGGGLSEAGTT